MLPVIEVPELIKNEMKKYRDIFCGDKGFEHVSRYVTGLLISPNKASQGIYDIQVWADGEKPSYRAMHESIFEREWRCEDLMFRHRMEVSQDHRGKGREIISLDWTFSHHDRGLNIYGTKKSYDYVEDRMSNYQTIMTAVVSNRSLIDGIDLVVQNPAI